MSCSRRSLKRARPLLGTFVEIEVRGRAPERALHEQINDGFSAVAEVDRLMSFHRSDSDVSRLNRDAWRHPVRVHPFTYRVVRKALELSRATEGLFDITVAPKLVEWGYLPADSVPGDCTTAASGAIRLLPDFRIRFTQPLWIDLGGIAKGYAVDSAVRALRKAGARSGVVNAGGDLRVFGAPRRIRVRNPRCPGDALPVAQVQNQAVATSAGYYSRRRVRGRWVTPILGPGGRVWNGRDSVTVSARDCMTADALTKVAALAGPRSSAVLKRFGAQALFLS